MTISDLGEKRLISEVLKPLLNPGGNPDSIGDDCAILSVVGSEAICVSTDRVPADLVAYELSLVDLRQLGFYLAVLNISDIAAAGGKPLGLLLNLALPPEFLLADFKTLVEGVIEASKAYGCPVVGGDLSDSREMNLVVTSVGSLTGSDRLYRSGARPGDVVFCSNVVGITPTAFTHFRRKQRAQLSADEEDMLCTHFRRPKASVALGSLLRASQACSSVMDNTDGVGQSLSELADASGVAMYIDPTTLPVDEISRRLAELYGINVVDMVLGAGADFQLIGTARQNAPGFEAIKSKLHIIGSVNVGAGLWINRPGAAPEPLAVQGWNYYKSRTQ